VNKTAPAPGFRVLFNRHVGKWGWKDQKSGPDSKHPREKFTFDDRHAATKDTYTELTRRRSPQAAAARATGAV